MKYQLAKIKNNKARGQVEILIEILTASEDSWIHKLAELINRIYDNGEILDDLSKFLPIALPKKYDANK